MVGVISDIGDERELVDVAVRLGARSVPGWSEPEERLAASARRRRDRGPGRAVNLAAVRDQIQAGEDPLGDAFCRLRARAERRALGQTFTPPPVIASMITWAAGAIEAGGAAGTGRAIGTDGVVGSDGVVGMSGAAGPGRAARTDVAGPGRVVAGSGGAAGEGDGGPARVVDPGAGSARFLIAAGRRWHRASLLGAEVDPVVAIIGRAGLAAAGLAGRSRVLLEDYRTLRLPPAVGPTVFIGNPPYLRHHQIPPDWKRWLRSTASALDLPSSGLAGLHVHFFLATATHAVPGDLGVFITAAEWLDVNYGRLVRALMLGPLGGESVHLIEPAVPVFSDAQATSAISCFTPGSGPRPLRLRRVASVAELGALAGGAAVPARSLAAAGRWGPMLRAAAGVSRPAPRLPGDRVELGELCRVHRGQATGANAVWVVAAGAAGADGVPERFRFPAVTRARELFQAWDVLPVGTPLRAVIDLPADLGQLSAQELHDVELFLGRARDAGAADSYIARHRRPWWRVRLREPPPILATYMARRPPAFVRNLAGARYLNIAHGIYPRELLPAGAIDGLAAFLRGSVVDGLGRVYAGGLLKFEPGEMQRLPVPGPQLLAACADPVRSSRGTTCGAARTRRE